MFSEFKITCRYISQNISLPRVGLYYGLGHFIPPSLYSRLWGVIWSGVYSGLFNRDW